GGGSLDSSSTPAPVVPGTELHFIPPPPLRGRVGVGGEHADEPRPTAPPIAIVGMAARFGPFEDLRTFQERVLGGAVPGARTTLRKGGGVPDSGWYRRERRDRPATLGYATDEITLPLDRFRIPPRELEEMLPQQLLALEVAADAIADARWEAR